MTTDIFTHSVTVAAAYDNDVLADSALSLFFDNARSRRRVSAIAPYTGALLGIATEGRWFRVTFEDGTFKECVSASTMLAVDGYDARMSAAYEEARLYVEKVNREQLQAWLLANVVSVPAGADDAGDVREA